MDPYMLADPWGKGRYNYLHHVPVTLTMPLISHPILTYLRFQTPLPLHFWRIWKTGRYLISLGSKKRGYSWNKVVILFCLHSIHIILVDWTTVFIENKMLHWSQLICVWRISSTAWSKIFWRGIFSRKWSPLKKCSTLKQKGVFWAMLMNPNYSPLFT